MFAALLRSRAGSEMSRSRFRNSRSKRLRRNETNSRNEDAKKSYPKTGPAKGPKESKSGRVWEGQNSRIWRPSESGHFSIKILLTIGRFWAPAGPGPIRGVFGRSETGCPEGRPERPPRRSTTRSKSTRSSRLCSVSLSSVLFCLVLLRDVVVGKISFLRPEVGLVFFCAQRSD